MDFLESMGQMFRNMRSDDSKLFEFDPAIASHEASIEVASPAFVCDGNIPIEYSADGSGTFPEIRWANLPEATQSLVLVIEDPDAPKPTPFIHCIAYNIPPRLEGLADHAILDDGLSAQARSCGIKLGRNSIGRANYLAPTPPPKHGPHRYHFQLIALDTLLEFRSKPTLGQIKKAINGHVIAFGELVGVYERK